MFEGLSISIGATGTDAQAAVRGVREQLQETRQAATGMAGGLSIAGDAMDETTSDAVGLSLGLRGLKSQADEAGDEMVEAGAQATSASGGLSLFGSSATGASFGVRSLSTAVISGLIPALTLLAPAVLPIVSALGGLAAIAGSIGFVGLAAGMGAIATETTALKAVFDSIVSTLKSEFAPVFQEAAQVLAVLGSRFEDIIPQMVPAEDTINSLSGVFAELGATIIENIPAFVDLAVTLTQEFLPPFVEFVHNVLPTVPGMIQGMVGEFRRLAPLFMDFGRTVGRLLPGLMEFGRTVLSVVAPALGDLAGLVQRGLSAFNSLGGASQQTATKLGLLAGPLASLVSLLGGPAGVGVLGAVIALKRAWSTNFADIRSTLTTAFSAIQRVLGNRLPGLITSIRELFRTWRPVIEPAVNFLVQLLSFGVVNALDLVLSSVTALAQVLSGDFTAAWQTVTGALDRFVSRFFEFLNSLSGGAFQQIVNQLITGLNEIGMKADEFLGEIGLGGSFNFQKLEQVNLGRTPVTPGRGAASQPPSGPQEVRVSGELKEENGEITAKIDERVQLNNERQNREYQARRGGPRPTQ